MGERRVAGTTTDDSILPRGRPIMNFSDQHHQLAPSARSRSVQASTAGPADTASYPAAYHPPTYHHGCGNRKKRSFGVHRTEDALGQTAVRRPTQHQRCSAALQGQHPGRQQKRHAERRRQQPLFVSHQAARPLHQRQVRRHVRRHHRCGQVGRPFKQGDPCHTARRRPRPLQAHLPCWRPAHHI